MIDPETEGRIAALEVILFAALRCLDRADFIAEYDDEKERALTGLLNNSTVPDVMHDALERQLKLYESYLLGRKSNDS